MNKVGQISSPNKGSYDQEAYPTEEDFINEWEAIKADFESIDEDIFILEEEQIISTPPNQSDLVTVVREEKEEGGSFNLALIICGLIICFLMPWICIGLWHIR